MSNGVKWHYYYYIIIIIQRYQYRRYRENVAGAPHSNKRLKDFDKKNTLCICRHWLEDRIWTNCVMKTLMGFCPAEHRISVNLRGPASAWASGNISIVYVLMMCRSETLTDLDGRISNVTQRQKNSKTECETHNEFSLLHSW